MAQTSKSTVSRVLNGGKVSEKIRLRIEAIMAEHQYVPSLAARALSHGRKGLVAVITPFVGSAYTMEVLKGIEHVFRNNDTRILCSFARDSADYAYLMNQMDQQGFVDGGIALAIPTDISPSMGNPNWISISSNPDNIPTVNVDNRQGMNDIMNHLYSQNCRTFWHFRGSPHYYDSQKRAESVEKWISEHPDCQCSTTMAGYNTDTGRKLCCELWKGQNLPLPDAIICPNDQCCAGVIEALQSDPPKVMPIVTGFDGDVSSRTLKHPTVHQPMSELGRTAAELFLQQLRGETLAPLTLIQPTFHL